MLYMQHFMQNFIQQASHVACNLRNAVVSDDKAFLFLRHVIIFPQSVLCSGRGVIFTLWTAYHGTFLNLGERPVNYSCPGQFVANISSSDLTEAPVCKLAETEAGAVRRPHVRFVRSFRASTPYVYSVRPSRRFDQSGYSWRCT